MVLKSKPKATSLLRGGKFSMSEMVLQKENLIILDVQIFEKHYFRIQKGPSIVMPLFHLILYVISREVVYSSPAHTHTRFRG